MKAIDTPAAILGKQSNAQPATVATGTKILVKATLRSTSVTYNTTTDSCTVQGTVSGYTAEARMESCLVCDPGVSNSCAEAGDRCTVAQVNSYDNTNQTQTIDSATFKLEKMPASVNLGTILAMPEGAAKQTALLNACAAARTH